MKQYPQLVAKAEEAVSGIKDTELKRVAFEKVLDDLLSEEAEPSPRSPTKRELSQDRKRGVGSKRAPKAGGPKAYIIELLSEGFFKKVKTMGEVKAELDNRGHHIPYTSLSGPLQTLCQDRKLRRQKIDHAGKKTFGYSTW
jgi:hypothetical protein